MKKEHVILIYGLKISKIDKGKMKTTIVSGRKYSYTSKSLYRFRTDRAY
jgi:hypothetical protein